MREKTEVLVSGSDDHPVILIDSQQLYVVERFNYLGCMIDGRSGEKKDVKARIGKAAAAFSLLSKQLWRRRDISNATKFRVYNASVRPILLYGCETWPLLVKDVNLLCAFERRCYRRILRLLPRMHIDDAIIKSRFPNYTPVVADIQRRQLRWLGHVLRMDACRLPRKLFLSVTPAKTKKRPGGQPKSWDATVRALLDDKLKRTYGRDWYVDWKRVLTDVACDRAQWKMLVEDCCDG